MAVQACPETRQQAATTDQARVRSEEVQTSCLAVPMTLIINDPERLTQTYLQQVNVNKEFRPVADAFAAIRYLHIVPQLIREPDRSVGRIERPIRRRLPRQLRPLRGNRRCGPG